MDCEELFRQYRETGSIEIRNKIVERYLYIASVLAKKFVGRGVEYDDLYQVATLALIKGVDRFDETKGLQFSTFITPTITGEIKNYFRDHSRLVHLPRKVAELRIAMKREQERILAETGKQATAKELASLLGVSEEEIVRAMEAGNVVSLDKPMDGDEEMSYYDVLSDGGSTFEEFESKDALESALSELSDLERKIVKGRFEDGLSQKEVSERLGVSQMFVSRMERKILDKLKKNLQDSIA